MVPADVARGETEPSPSRDQDDVVNRRAPGPSALLGLEDTRVAGDDIAHRHLGIATGGDEFLTLVVGDVGTSASGVFLLPGPEKIGRVGDLGLDLLLAVAEVVVGDDRDDDTGLVAGAQLERCLLYTSPSPRD